MVRCGCLLTCLVVGLVGEVSKQFWVLGALIGWQGGQEWSMIRGGMIAWPAIVQHEVQC
jgi:hypothetical protein